jgi:copper chaperone
MKNIAVLMVAAFLAFACNSANKSGNDTSAQQEEINVENLVEVMIPVNGMTCEGCENAVKKSINSLEGIAEVSASHTDSIATVKYDKTAVTRDEIELKIAAAGYVVAEE